MNDRLIDIEEEIHHQHERYQIIGAIDPRDPRLDKILLRIDELRHEKAKLERQALGRFNMENDTKLGMLPKVSSAWDYFGIPKNDLVVFDDDKCKCDIHRLMAFGHDAGCKESGK